MPTRFAVHVVPGSSRPGPDGRHGGMPRLRLNAAPTGGKANAEAERILTEELGARVRLLRGGRSRQKTFEVELDAAMLAARLRRVFGD